MKVKINKHFKEWSEFLSYNEMTATKNFDRFEATDTSILDLKTQIDIFFKRMAEISAVSAKKAKVLEIENRLN